MYGAPGDDGRAGVSTGALSNGRSFKVWSKVHQGTKSEWKRADGGLEPAIPLNNFIVFLAHLSSQSREVLYFPTDTLYSDLLRLLHCETCSAVFNHP